MFILIFVMLSIVLIVSLFLKTNVDVRAAEMNLFFYELLYSKNGLSYYDKNIDRLYPGIINYEEFANTALMEEKLAKAFNFGDHHVLAANISNVYYNKEWFSRWDVLSRAGLIKGAGGALEIRKTAYVQMLYPNGEIKPYQLDISIATSNT